MGMREGLGGAHLTMIKTRKLNPNVINWRAWLRSALAFSPLMVLMLLWETWTRERRETTSTMHITVSLPATYGHIFTCNICWTPACFHRTRSRRLWTPLPPREKPLPLPVAAGCRWPRGDPGTANTRSR